MSMPTTAKYSPLLQGLNGPGSPPVLFCERQQYGSHPSSKKENGDCFYNDDGGGEEDERCRSCHSASVRTDWREGDKVCTNCGVVAEQRVLDDRPEWKDFQDADDLAKGLPAPARSGLVPVDESKYLGGLQPTTLSRHGFGGDLSGYSEAQIRKRLRTTNRKLDTMMVQFHAKALKDAKLDHKIRLKKKQQQQDDGGYHDDSIRPEYDQLLLQEEEDAHRMQAALYADKWSLSRALSLHSSGPDDLRNHSDDAEELREDLLARMDGTLRRASEDLYLAYSMLLQAARNLHLPDRVINEASNRLVQYVTRRDGFACKGVSSRLSSKGGTEFSAQRKQAMDRLREYNKLKQIGSLGCALLFLTARNLGWPRSMHEVCTSFQPSNDSIVKESAFIKPKHCHRAIQEIKAAFPDYARIHMGPRAATSASPTTSSEAADALVASNFAEHSLRKLQIPPVAEAAIRTLLTRCRKEQLELGHNSGTKLSTLCGAVAYFVCEAGAVMQRLAQQVKNRPPSVATSISGNSYFSSSSPSGSRKRKARLLEPSIPRKRLIKQAYSKSQLTLDQIIDEKKDENSHSPLPSLTDMAAVSNLDLESSSPGLPIPSGCDRDDDKDEEDEDEDQEPFDVFSHPAIQDFGSSSRKLEYEMRRMWDAWAEQMPWSRTVGEIEESCGVSRTKVLEMYRTDLYPRREKLLQVLKDALTSNDSNEVSSLLAAPLAPILLSHISTAATVMNSKRKL